LEFDIYGVKCKSEQGMTGQCVAGSRVQTFVVRELSRALQNLL